MSGVGSGLQRAQRFLLLATALYRTSHLAVGIAAVARRAPGTTLGSAPWTVLGCALALTLLLYGTAYARGWFDARWIWADVLVTGCALPFVGAALLGDEAVAPKGWLMLLGGSATAAAGAGLRPRAGALAVLAVVVGHATARGHVSGELVGHLISVVSSAGMTAVFWWYLKRQGTMLDEAKERAVTAEARRARQAERMAHHRALHDTVLATLTAIAAGGVDANAPQVRERCAREAAYLRRLIQREDQGEEPGPPSEVPMGRALEEAVRSAECLGLAVSAQYHGLPAVPGPVATALASAAAEALNNVRTHAGTGRAWLTAVGEGTGVVVTVVDRGVGFDPERVPVGGAGAVGGTGLRRSVRARMAAVGGAADVDSAPGEGTRIELRWPG
ncbi:ATP-binding protein [Streptomyces sp. NRRL S-87]|uniref:ATP-binding protein n=1 Tax=Streptomyces sp. NRRL S-87 TaxID=1463920 RepID=UPI000689B131|nr:ATP-binding protein [Streptomyces sp. NRRL S-87]